MDPECEYFTERKAKTTAFNQQLRECNCITHLRALLMDMQECDMKHVVVTKRRGLLAFQFDGICKGKRVYYLIDDTKSHGNCLVKNLYRYLKII